MSISLPYSVDPHPHLTNWAIWGSDGMTICHVTDRGGETPELAEFVVRACNAHEEMVAALRDIAIAPCMAELLGRPVDQEDPCWCPGCRARAALSKAEGK